jgi:hypothetical protein
VPAAAAAAAACLQLKLRAPESKDHMLDHLARWNAMNGDVLVVSLPEAVCCTCGSGSTF